MFHFCTNLHESFKVFNKELIEKHIIVKLMNFAQNIKQNINEIISFFFFFIM